MMELYIARHGETEWNREGRLQGWDDSPLTSLGEKQAEALGERLKELSLYKVYMSPLGRVESTAQIALAGLSLPVEKDERLKELKLGEWEGLRSDEAKKRYPELYRKALEEPHRFDPPWKEDYYELKERVVEAAEQILANEKGKNVLLISHGLASKTLLSYFEERPIKDLRKPPHLRECSLSLVKFDEAYFENSKKCEIVLYGDTAHLNGIEE